jgi:hypothetical protein
MYKKKNMYTCNFCEKAKIETWTGSWCETCRKLKNLGNVYGFEELYKICDRVCVRSNQQRTNKINMELKKEVKKINDDSDESYVKKDGKWSKPSASV